MLTTFEICNDEFHSICNHREAEVVAEAASMEGEAEEDRVVHTMERQEEEEDHGDAAVGEEASFPHRVGAVVREVVVQVEAGLVLRSPHPPAVAADEVIRRVVVVLHRPEAVEDQSPVVEEVHAFLLVGVADANAVAH